MSEWPKVRVLTSEEVARACLEYVLRRDGIVCEDVTQITLLEASASGYSIRINFAPKDTDAARELLREAGVVEEP
jgi:hypothetical protein